MTNFVKLSISMLHCFHDLCHISALQSIAGEGMTCDEFCQTVHEHATHLKHSDMSDAITNWVVCHLKHSDVSDVIPDWVVCRV